MNVCTASVLSLLLVGMSHTQARLPDSRPAHIVVYVHAGEGQPVAGVHVELVQTGEVRTTGADGRVRFAVAAGDYVVRVHDLQGPGPALRQGDFSTRVRRGQKVLISVFDCLMCV